MNTIEDLKNYLIEIGYDKKKIESYQNAKENFYINLIISEIKKKDKIFREEFYKIKKKKLKKKNKFSNLIDTINNN